MKVKVAEMVEIVEGIELAEIAKMVSGRGKLGSRRWKDIFGSKGLSRCRATWYCRIGLRYWKWFQAHGFVCFDSDNITVTFY